MRVISSLSLIARIALMITMIIGLLYWIAQIPSLSVVLAGILQSGLVITLHMLVGVIGVLFLLALSFVLLFARGVRLLGMAGIIYALILPVFGRMQALLLIGSLHWVVQIAHLLIGIGAMYLAQALVKRYQRLRQFSPRYSITESA